MEYVRDEELMKMLPENIASLVSTVDECGLYYSAHQDHSGELCVVVHGGGTALRDKLLNAGFLSRTGTDILVWCGRPRLVAKHEAG